jgi:hypothetical protein
MSKTKRTTEKRAYSAISNKNKRHPACQPVARERGQCQPCPQQGRKDNTALATCSAADDTTRYLPHRVLNTIVQGGIADAETRTAVKEFEAEIKSALSKTILEIVPEENEQADQQQENNKLKEPAQDADIPPKRNGSVVLLITEGSRSLAHQAPKYGVQPAWSGLHRLQSLVATY